jgi:diphthamide biosynthesis protein 2
MTTSAIHPTTAPVLSTPESHIFEDPTPPADPTFRERLSDEELYVRYEIPRTVRQLREGRWRRVALQFEDGMLGDAVRVYDALGKGLCEVLKDSDVDDETRAGGNIPSEEREVQVLQEEMGKVGLHDSGENEEVKVFILADTSYGACCVDEIAAEHVDADVVVHYGRSCLSPTTRLPVIYVYTTRPLDVAAVVDALKNTYADRGERIILMADLPYSAHVQAVFEALENEGYSNLFSTDVIHNPSSPLPNRTVPVEVEEDITKLKDYQLFHIGTPPTALLLTLSSRLGAISIYPGDATRSQPRVASLASSTLSLRRRYALITSLSTVSIYGILINTLSVKSYLHMVDHVKKLISAAGKKHYTFVVGKINAAKVANFAEVGGWVVIGCWESSLVESGEFYRPLITPFELQLALQADKSRIWTGEWTSDFEAVLREKEKSSTADQPNDNEAAMDDEGHQNGSDSDSAPPEFDLRTGRYVSHTRPMRTSTSQRPRKKTDVDANPATSADGGQLIKRANGDVAQIGGVASPGAEFLRTSRTWQGLGSDFDTDGIDSGVDGTLVEEGRSGIARGYKDATTGEEKR